MELNIGDMRFNLTDKPKHRTVLAVQDVMTNWIMSRINLTELNQNMALEEAIRQAIVLNPTLSSEISSMQRTLAFDQTIMLATNLSYNELMLAVDDMAEDEYKMLYQYSVDALGGTASDFFGFYDTSMSGMMMTLVQPVPPTITTS